MKKGFTLIELLGTIVIITVMFFLLTPIVSKRIDDSRERVFEKQIDFIEKTARDWAYDHMSSLPVSESGTIVIYLAELKSSSYLTGDVVNPYTKEAFPDDMEIQIKLENEEYEFFVDTESGNTTTDFSHLNSNAILVGEANITVELGDDYRDEGAIFKNRFDGLITEYDTVIESNSTVVESVDTSRLGIYTITYTLTDPEGDVSISRTVTIVDTTAPTIVIHAPNDVKSNEIMAFDLMEGVFTEDNSTDEITVTVSGSLSVIPGIYDITYTAIDSNGNSSQLIRKITVIDAIAPTVTFTPTTSSWIRSTNVNVTAEDPHSGVLMSQYQWTTSTTAPAASSFVFAFDSGDAIPTPPGVTGDYYLWVRAYDTLYNEIITRSEVFRLDNILPTVSFGTNGNATYARTRSTTVTVNDTTSGVATRHYQWTNSTTAPTSGSFSTTFTNGATITSPASVTGAYYLWIKVVDNAGNTNITRTNVFNLDNTTPTVSFALNGAATYTRSAGTSITVSDPHSGVASRYYQWTTSTTAPTTGSFTTTFISGDTVVGTPVGATGGYYLWVKLIDNAGNEVITRSNVFNLDNTIPSVSFGTNGNSTYAKTRSTTVSVSDANAGVISRHYAWTTSTTAPLASSISTAFSNGATITSPVGVSGDYYLWIKAIDAAGNFNIIRSNVFKLDNTIPTITHPGTTTLVIAEVNTFNALTGVSATDNSGETPTVTATGSIARIASSYVITYSATDSSGNTRTVTRTINVVDVEAPVITITGATTVNIDSGTSYTELGATAIDDADLNVTSNIVTTGSVNAAVPGTYFITYTVTDSSGNTGSATRTVNVIDRILPTVSFGTNGNTTYAKTRSTTVSASDAHSGISTLHYQWTTSATTPTAASFTQAFTNGGTLSTPAGVTGGYYLWIKAVDGNANVRIIRTNVFNLNNTPPVIPTTVSGINRFTDTNYASGHNGMGIYNNTGNGNVTHLRTAMTTPTGSGYGIRITTAGVASPGHGGFYQITSSSANGLYAHTIVAKIPVGYSIQRAANATGTGSTTVWLSDQAGTGNWETYTYLTTAGATGTFSSLGHVYISGGVAPFSWDVAYTSMTESNRWGHSASVVFNATSVLNPITGYATGTSTTPGTYTTIAPTYRMSEVISGFTSNTTTYVWVRDSAGNEQKQAVVVNKIDTSNPTVVFGTNGNATYGTSRSTTVTASDTGSGIVSLHYLWSTSATAPSAASITTAFTNGATITSPAVNGAYYLWVKAIDGAGNTTIVRTNVFNLDATNPTVTFGTNGNATYGTVRSTTVTVADAHSGVSTRHYQWTTSTTAPTSASFTTTFTSGATITTPAGNGGYYLWIKAVDVAGNTFITRTNVFNLDNTLPTVAFGTNGSATPAKTRSTTVTVSDAYSGVSTRHYLWSTSTATPAATSIVTAFTNGATITTPAGTTGTRYLWIKAIDAAGNQSILRTNAFVLDNTVPVITLTGATTATVPVGGTYTDPGYTATDTTEGTITARVVKTGSVNTSVPGTYTLYYNLTDTAGNIAVQRTRTITVGTCTTGTLTSHATLGYVCVVNASSSSSCDSCTYNVTRTGTSCANCGSSCNSCQYTTSTTAANCTNCGSSCRTCTYSETTSASGPTYNCSGIGGSVVGSDCRVSRISTPSTSCSCPSGGTRSGTTCYQTTTVCLTCSCPSGYTKYPQSTNAICSRSYPASCTTTYTYSCPSGFWYNGSACYAEANGPYYSCPSGYSLSGTTCSRNVTAANCTRCGSSCNTCTYNTTTTGSNCTECGSTCRSCTYTDSTYGTSCANCGSTTSYYCASGWSTYSGSGSTLKCYRSVQ